MSSKPMRRAKGSGSIRQRSKGSWELKYEGPTDASGDRRMIYETMRGTRRDAERALRERLGMIESGSYVSKSKEPVAEFTRRWLQTYVLTRTTPSTQRGYEGVMRRYVNPALGPVELQNLQPAQIQALYAGMLERGLSARTTLHTHRVLRQALSHAVKWGSLARNPADVVTPPRPQRDNVDMWDLETVNRFIDIARGRTYGDIYHLAILTGMRRSELLGLQWANIDLAVASLRVVKTLQRINGRGLVLGQPKTGKSRRSIALGESAVVLLRGIKTRQLERRLAAGPVWEEGDYVFTQAYGKPLHPDKVSNSFRATVHAAGLPHLTLHGLRHAHATLMLTAGVHPKVVSERLGHANISVTMDIYSHVMPGLQEAAAQALDERLAEGRHG